MARHLLRRLILSTLLGFATTIALAWTLATGILDFPNPGEVAYRAGTDEVAAVFVYRYDRRGGLFLHAESGSVMAEVFSNQKTIDDLAPEWSRPLLVPWGWNARPGPADPGFRDRIVIARGWPFRALSCTLEGVPNMAYWTYKPIHGLIPSDSWRGFNARMPAADPPVTLPTRPLWPGFTADAAVFAAAWFLALFIPGPLLRTIRRRRGLCAHCAYNLRGLPANPVCPECGASGRAHP